MSEMQETMVVKDPAQLKVLADPIRQAILAAFTKPKTTKQVSTELGVAGTKLYHHVDLLEANGFLKLVESRPNRGTVERLLQVTAKKFVIQLGECDAGSAVYREAFQTQLAQVDDAMAAGHEAILARAVVKIEPKDLRRLEEAFTQALKSLHSESGKPVSVLMAAAPLICGGIELPAKSDE